MSLQRLCIPVVLAGCAFLPAVFAVSALLSLDLSIEETTITAGDSVIVNIAVENRGTFSKVATNPVITVQMPPGSGEFASADCVTASQATLVCEMAEIGMGETVNISITAVLNEIGHHKVSAELVADDLPGAIRSDAEIVTVLSQDEDLDPVDLAVNITVNGGSAIHQQGTGTITAVVRNSHPANTAYFPVVELQLPPALEFYSGDFCTATDETILCKVPTLSPQAEAKLYIALAGKSVVEGAVVNVFADSTQEDLQVDDNNAELVFDVVMQEILCGASNPLCLGGSDSEGTGDSDESDDNLSVIDSAEPVLSAGNNAESSGGGLFSGWLFCFFLCLYGMLKGNRYRA